MSFWDDLASPFVEVYEVTAGVATDGYQTAMSGAEQAGSALVEVGADALRSTESIGVVIGDGVVSAANTVGEGVVSFGTGIERFSVSQAGAVVDWSKTSAAEVSAWTQSAAGTVAAFSVEAYGVAKQGLSIAWNTLYTLFASHLPELGPHDSAARQIFSVVFDSLAAEIERGTRRDGTTIGFDFRLAMPVGIFKIGVYCDSTGQWGFFAGNLGNVADFTLALSTKLSADVEVTTVFGGRDDFSNRQVFKIGGSVRIAGPVRVGASILLSSSPGFVGFLVSFGLSLNTYQRAQQGKGAYQMSYPRLNTDAVMTEADSLLGTLSEEAPSWDAAARSLNNPDGEARIVATALAATVSPFQPRYYGALRTYETTPRSLALYDTQINGWSLILPDDVPLGSGLLIYVLARYAMTIRLITGLGDPSGVSIELHANGRTYVLSVENGFPLPAPYTTSGLRSSKKATFKLVRGLADSKGLSFMTYSEPPQYLVFNQGTLMLSDPSDTDPFKRSATFLLDSPRPIPPEQTSFIRPGELLRQGEFRRSGSGSHYLALRTTAELDLYRGSGPSDPAQDFWHSVGQNDTGPFFALMKEGRFGVYRGSDPNAPQGQVFTTSFFGSPGECFAAVTAAGQLAVFQGTPEEPGELVWSSDGGAVHWATQRRARIALRTYGGKYLSCTGGSGAELTASASGVGESEIFELLTLWNGKVALRGMSGSYVCAEQFSYSNGAVNVNRTRIDSWESFDLITLQSGEINLRASNGQYLCAEQGGGGAVHANRPVAAEWERFTVVEVPTECGWRSVRPQDSLVLTSAPAVAATSSYNMWIAYRGADNSQRLIRVANTTPEQPQTIVGTVLVGAPALAGRAGSDQVYTCHRGTPSGAFFASTTGTTHSSWSSFTPLGGALASAPALTACGNNRDLFALNSAGELIQTFWWEGAWQEWRNLGNPANVKLDSPPAAFSNENGHHVFARGTDKHLWHRSWNGQGWSAWEDLGGALNSGPAVASPGSGQLDVFARGEDNSLLHRAFRDGAWGAWERLGGRLSSAPAAVSRGPGGIDVFARGMDNGLIQTYFTNGGWVHKL